MKLNRAQIRKVFATNRLEILIALLVIAVYGYFFSCGGWNQNTRYNSIFAFTEPGTSDYLSFRIDRFIVDPVNGYNTGDWSFYEGHYYSNKAPGTTLIGIPFYSVLFWAEDVLGIQWQHPYVEIMNAYLINFFVSVLIVTLGVVYFYKLLLLRGLPVKRSFLFTMILAFGTSLFPFSTEFWGHTTAMSFFIFVLYNITRDKPLNYFYAGLFAGIATLTDYLALFPTITTGIFILIRNRKGILYFISGGLFPAFLMMGYHYICFGNILNTPTTFTNPLFIDKNRVMGLFGTVSPTVLYRLLFSIERGILIAMPVLLFAFPGFYFLFKKNKESMRFTIFSIVTIFLILIVNSSFYGWYGGDCAVARYQIIALPFWILLVSGIPCKKRWNIALISISIFSVFNMLSIAAVCLQPFGTDNYNPIYGYAYSNFFRGNFNLLEFPIRLQEYHPDWALFKDLTSFNLGYLIGLKGIPSLIPLIIIASVIILFIRKVLIKVSEQIEIPESGD